MSAVGETPNGLEFIWISSHISKNIQEGSADIIFENIDILSHPIDEYLVHKSFKKKDFLGKILFMLKKENSRVKIVLVCCYLFKNIFC